MHRRDILLASAFVAAIATTGAIAHGTGAGPNEETSAALVERAERAWAEAFVKKDAERVGALLDKRFHLMRADVPGAWSRDIYLQNQTGANWPVRSMTPTKITVSVNDKVAVAVVDMTIDWEFKWHRHWLFIDTWVWSDGEWRAVTRVSQFIKTD